MYIVVLYRDNPDLVAGISKRKLGSESVDSAIEKSLLVNPNCPVRILLEYIRDTCQLGTYTQFDLCDEQGQLKYLFGLPSHECALEQFEYKKTYYIVVFKPDGDRRPSVLPQLNRNNKNYSEIKIRVKRQLEKASESTSSRFTSPSMKQPSGALPRKSVATKSAPKH